MNLQELLWFVFTDEFVGSLLFPMSEKYVLQTALIFQESEKYKFYIFAFLGSFLGALLNYAFGRLCQKGFELKITIDKRIENTILFSLILLPLSFFGPVISFLAALSRMKFSRFFILSLLIWLGYFSLMGV